MTPNTPIPRQPHPVAVAPYPSTAVLPLRPSLTFGRVDWQAVNQLRAKAVKQAQKRAIDNATTHFLTSKEVMAAWGVEHEPVTPTPPSAATIERLEAYKVGVYHDRR